MSELKQFDKFRIPAEEVQNQRRRITNPCGEIREPISENPCRQVEIHSMNRPVRPGEDKKRFYRESRIISQLRKECHLPVLELRQILILVNWDIDEARRRVHLTINDSMQRFGGLMDGH